MTRGFGGTAPMSVGGASMNSEGSSDAVNGWVRAHDAMEEPVERRV
ncbi:hypothetical protein FM112_02020 [Gulosibacter sp. 10]|nr:hypothetical protein FM112_02020 [Gulosibacter sp. 10]